MKRAFTLIYSVRWIAIALVLGFSAVVASAQCDHAAETAAYQKFLDSYKGTPEQQKTANDLGKDYVAKFGECPSDEEKKITDYIRKWLAKYQDAVIEWNCTNAVDKTPGKAFDLCQPLLAKDPESLRTHVLLSMAGLRNLSAGDTKSNELALKETQKVLDLIASGKTLDKWIVADSKDEAVGLLQYYSGYLMIDNAPADAMAALTKAAQSSSSYGKNPITYQQLGRAIYNDQIKKQAVEYDDKCAVTDSAPDCASKLEKINQSLDRIIDAYARASALSIGKPEYKEVADYVNPRLTTFYKKRHDDSVAGLEQLVSNVLSKPLP